MTDWTTDKNGTITHPWCGCIIPGARGQYGKPTAWTWVDRQGRERATFATLAEAKLAARKFSGVEVR